MRYTSPASPAAWMTPRPVTVPHEMPSGTEGVGGAAAGRAVSSAVGMPLTLLAYRPVGRQTGSPVRRGSRTAGAGPVAWRRAEAREVASSSVSVTQVNVIVPGNHLMAGLLGHRDEHLRQIERSFPETDILVRGNEITVAGQRRRAGRPAVRGAGRAAAAGPAARRARTCAARSTWCARHERPSEVLTHDILRGAKGRTGAAEDGRPEALHRRHPRQRHHLRHRPGRHRQELAGGGDGGAGAAGQAGAAHHPHPAGGRGRRAARASCPAT